MLLLIPTPIMVMIVAISCVIIVLLMLAGVYAGVMVVNRLDDIRDDIRDVAERQRDYVGAVVREMGEDNGG